MYLLICLIYILSFMTKLIFCNCNNNPVVGVLAQETYWSSFKDFKPLHTFIAASYVKAIETSGGQVIPIFPNKTTKYYRNIVNQVNGIVIPGGGSAFDMNFGISKSVNEIFHIAKEINDKNDHFPIIGLCLGLELLVMASIDGKNPLKDCNAKNINLPLELLPGMEEISVLFKTMPSDIRNILLTEPVTANYHKKCLTNQNFTSMNLDKFWNAITISEDQDSLPFISIIEAKTYPFVGLMFHSEKNAYEWRKNWPHSWSAIYSGRYFYDQFLKECRQNEHKFMNKTIMENELIYNYPTTYVGKLNYSYEQVYFFLN